MNTVDFSRFLELITHTDPTLLHLTIRGQTKIVKGMAEFRTINLGDDGYIKFMFTDGSFLLVVPSTQQLYYADEVIGHITAITDDMIGNVHTLVYEGREFKLENKDDYQYTIRLYCGGPDDIEGEARFSDYVPTDGNVEILSLGWTTRNGERADIYCKELSLDEVEV